MNTRHVLAPRLMVLGCCFLGAAALGARARRPEAVPARTPLTDMPAHVGAWTVDASPPLDRDVLSVLGVDDYVNRVYARADQSAVGLYIGYYASQRQGDSIHSPLNCLPGAGWQGVSRTYVALTLTGAREPLVVNRFVVQKGVDRQVVLYWYQSHGRVEASEYWSKAYLVWDAIRSHRSDGALVRIVAPVLSSDSSTDPATGRATAFADALFPQLERFLPS